jgi:hypothetical protein
MSTPDPNRAEASYRAWVKLLYTGEPFSPDKRSALEDHRAHWKLSRERAREIEQEVIGESKSNRQSPPDPPSVNKVEEPNSEESALEKKPAEKGNAEAFPLNINSQRFNPSDEETRPPTPPPGSPEEYILNFNRYKQDLRQAIRSEGLSLRQETNARLSQRAKELNLKQEDAAYIRALKQYVTDLRQAIQIEDLSLNPKREPYLSKQANQLRLDEQDTHYLEAIELYRRELRRSVRLEGLSLSAGTKARLAQLATQQNLTKADVEYVQRLVDYGQEVLQLLRTAPYDPADEAGEREKRERKQTLAKQYHLDNDDTGDIDREMLAEYYLNPSVPPKPPSGPLYNPDLIPLFEVLEGHLKAGELENADIATWDILQRVIAPRQTWLNAELLSQESIPKKNKGAEAIQEINRLWTEYSNGKFGFSRQLAIYKQSEEGSVRSRSSIDNRQDRLRALAFSKQVEWWIRGLEFLKFYRQLQFDFDAPVGHLPAYWFWKIPFGEAFRLGNLRLLPERGGCRVDALTIPAFMNLLERCGIKPAEERQIAAMQPTRPVEQRKAEPAE